MPLIVCWLFGGAGQQRVEPERRVVPRDRVQPPLVGEQREQRTVQPPGQHLGPADAGQHRGTYAVGVFVAALRGQGLGREVTRLVLAWDFGQLGLHRIELEVLAFNTRAIRCYLACGFRSEGIRREAELYPVGWQDLIVMGLPRSEYAA